jgi:hypothetical protein
VLQRSQGYLPQFSTKPDVLRPEKLCFKSQCHLTDQHLNQLLEKVDADLTEKARQEGCLLCGGTLHRSDYERKPHGDPQWDTRFSLCCAQEGYAGARAEPGQASRRLAKSVEVRSHTAGREGCFANSTVIRLLNGC